MKRGVVVGYDQTAGSEIALTVAGREAAARGVPLTVVNACVWVPPTAPVASTPATVQDYLRQSAQEIAERGAGKVRAMFPEVRVHAVSASAPASEALVDLSRTAALVVVGTRGRGGFAGLLLGSVSQRTIGGSECPVLVARGTIEPARGRVVAALDIDDPSGSLLEFAAAEAVRRSGELAVHYAWDGSWAGGYYDSVADLEAAAKQAAEGLDGYLAGFLRPWEADYPSIRISHAITVGAPADILCRASREADLVVCGARRPDGGRSGMRTGPVTHALLRHADCPVAVVPRD